MASFGYCSFDDEDSFDEALKKSDEAMYTDKQNYKHR